MAVSLRTPSLQRRNGARVRFCSSEPTFGPWSSCFQQLLLYFGWCDGPRGLDWPGLTPPRLPALQAEVTQAFPCLSYSAHMLLMQGLRTRSSFSCLEGSSHPHSPAALLNGFRCHLVRDGCPPPARVASHLPTTHIWVAFFRALLVA